MSSTGKIVLLSECGNEELTRLIIVRTGTLFNVSGPRKKIQAFKKSMGEGDAIEQAMEGLDHFSFPVKTIQSLRHPLEEYCTLYIQRLENGTEEVRSTFQFDSPDEAKAFAVALAKGRGFSTKPDVVPATFSEYSSGATSFAFVWTFITGGALIISLIPDQDGQPGPRRHGKAGFFQFISETLGVSGSLIALVAGLALAAGYLYLLSKSPPKLEVYGPKE